MTAPVDGRVPPTLPGGRVVGSVLDVRRDYLGTIARAAREVGPLTRVVAGPPGWRVVLYVVGSPELAAEILQEPTRYGKSAPGYRELRGALGNNVLTSEDETWHRQRRFLAPIFTRRRILAAYAPVMIEEANRLVDRWRVAAAEGRTLDTYPEMISVAARVSGRILFGADMTRALDLLRRFRTINDQLLRRARQPAPPPRLVADPSKPSAATVDWPGCEPSSTSSIAERRTRGTSAGADDMLSLLVAARRRRERDRPAER